MEPLCDECALLAALLRTASTRVNELDGVAGIEMASLVIPTSMLAAFNLATRSKELIAFVSGRQVNRQRRHFPQGHDLRHPDVDVMSRCLEHHIACRPPDSSLRDAIHCQKTSPSKYLERNLPMIFLTHMRATYSQPRIGPCRCKLAVVFRAKFSRPQSRPCIGRDWFSLAGVADAVEKQSFDNLL